VPIQQCPPVLVLVLIIKSLQTIFCHVLTFLDVLNNLTQTFLCICGAGRSVRGSVYSDGLRKVCGVDGLDEKQEVNVRERYPALRGSDPVFRG